MVAMEKKWTKEEVQYLIDNYGKKSLKDLAKHIGRPYTVVNSKVQYLKKRGKITRKNEARSKNGNKGYINWEEKDPFIINNYHSMTGQQIAEILGVKYPTLMNRIRKLKKEGRITGMLKDETRSRINEDGAGPKIAILDGNMEIGKKYRIRKLGHVGKNEMGEFVGELIQKTKYFYTFKNDERAESFLKVDFVIGEYTIDEIRRNKNE